MLSRVTHSPAVIFTTAHSQFAVTAFELAALDYLLKPFGRERFGRRSNGRGRCSSASPAPRTDRARRDALAAGADASPVVREAGPDRPDRVAAIERLEACDDFVIVHTAGRRFRLNLTLSDLERRLDPRHFVRVHRSHIVNLDHVASWMPYDGSRYQIALRSGATIVASRQRSRGSNADPIAVHRRRRPFTGGRVIRRDSLASSNRSANVFAHAADCFPLW